MNLRDTIYPITVDEEVKGGRPEQKAREAQAKALRNHSTQSYLGRETGGRGEAGEGARADYKLLCKPNMTVI